MNDPTRATIAANAALRTSLPFDDTDDFERAERGLLAPLPDTVSAADGRTVWDARKFDFVAGEAPESVNPSLWRQEQLNGIGDPSRRSCTATATPTTSVGSVGCAPPRTSQPGGSGSSLRWGSPSRR